MSNLTFIWIQCHASHSRFAYNTYLTFKGYLNLGTLHLYRPFKSLRTSFIYRLYVIFILEYGIRNEYCSHN